MAAFGLFDRFDPFAEIGRLQREVNELFDTRGWWRALGRRGGEFPQVNVVSIGDEVVVSAECPGMALADIELSITGGALTIKGKRTSDAKVPEQAYHRRERTFGSFARSIQLPERVAAEKAEARYVNGVLEVRIPHAAEAKPRKIAVTSG